MSKYGILFVGVNMNKKEIINNALSEIVQLNLIKCCFTDESALNTNHKTINLYCITTKDRYETFISEIDNLKFCSSVRIYKKIENNKFTFFYDNGVIIVLSVFTDENTQIEGKIYSLFDPYEILTVNNQRSYAFTISEFSKKFDEISVLLLEYYNSCIMKDRLLAYSKTLEIQKIFVYIYRGFYDSINAKRGYSDISISIGQNEQYKLENIIRLFTYDNFIEAVNIVLKELNNIVNSLPVTVISLMNYNFFVYVKELIENI